MGREITVTIQWHRDNRHDDPRCVVASNAYNYCPSCGQKSPAYGYIEGDARAATTASIWESDLLCPHCKDKWTPLALYPCPVFAVGGPVVDR